MKRGGEALDIADGVDEAPLFDAVIIVDQAEETVDIISKLGIFDDRDEELKHARRPRADYDGLPSEFRPNLWGEAIIKPIRLGDMLFFDQVRQSRNPEYDRIAESIENEGLHKQPDIDALDEEHFIEYLRAIYFRKFKGELPEEIIDWFEPDQGGWHNVVTNGNTRGRILIQKEKQKAVKAKRAGYTVNPYDAETMAKFHYNRDPAAILGSQISDNFQSSPPQENVALVTVSYYQYLRATGKVQSREDYIREVGGTLTKEMLGGMVEYSKLPEGLHEMVDDKSLPFNVVIELAKLRERKLLEMGLKIYGHQYLMHVSSFDAERDDGSDALMAVIDEKDAQEIRESIEKWLMHIAADLYHKKQRDRTYSPTRQIKAIRARSDEIEAAITEMIKTDEPELPAEDDEFDTDTGKLAGSRLVAGRKMQKSMRAVIERELQRQAREIAQNPIEKVNKVAGTFRELGAHSANDVLDNLKAREAMRIILGAVGMKDAELDSVGEYIETRQLARAASRVAEAEFTLF